MKSSAARLTHLVLASTMLVHSGCQSKAPPQHPASGTAINDLNASQELARTRTDEAFELLAHGKFDEAENRLKKAIGADPLYGPAHNDMGLIYYHRQDFYNAAWEFENAAKLMPRHAPPVNNLGLVLEKAGKISDAEKSFSAAVELDPQNVEYIGNYARARIRLGERDETTRHLLEKILLMDHRPEWIEWAREQASRIAKPIPD